MRRRHRGGAVLLGVFAAAVLLTQVTARSVPGTARSVPVPGPPAVGDCVRVLAATGLEADPAVGACRGAVHGQVARVIADPGRGAAGGADPAGGNTQDCVGPYPLDEHLPAGADSGTAYGGWSVELGQVIGMIGPTARQSAAGQHWQACVLSPAGTAADQFAVFPAPVSEWRRSRAVAEAVGRCAVSATPTLDSGNDCLLPHTAEVFGWSGRPATPALDAGCRALVADLTAMPDPTAGGRLRVEVLGYDRNGAPLAPAAAAGTAVRQVCVVTGHQLLDGTLLALGDRPVPWA